MPDQEENIQMEKLDNNAFGEGLDNNFGIEDTQLIASQDLQKFLMSDPDDVKNVEEEAKKAKVKEEVDKAEAERLKALGQQPPTKKKEDEKPDSKKLLEDMLFNEDEEVEEEPKLGPDGKPIIAPPKAATSGEDDDTYKTLSKDLLRLGVFSKTSDDETEETIDISTPEAFLERFGLEKKKGAIGILDSFLSQFGEDYRKMFDSIFVNGVKPQEYLQSFVKIEAIKDLDLADEDNQSKIVRSYYKSLKWDDAKIDARIQKLKDYGDMEDEAKTYHEVLLNKEKEQVATIEKAKTDEVAVQKEKDTATQKSFQRILTEKLKAQEIDGIPLTQADAEAVFAYMVNKPFKLASGELLSEFDKDILELNRPENHEQKVKLGLLMKKKLDLSSVKKSAVSKKSDALFTLSTKNAKQAPAKKELKSFF